MHDLIRRYATDTARHNLAAEAREAALLRVIDFYLHTAHAAAHLVHRHRVDIQLDTAAPGSRPHPPADEAAAMAWFDTEHPCLLAIQHTASALGRGQAVWQLAWVLSTFHQLRGYRHDQLAIWRAALDAAEHLSDPTPRLLGHRYLGLTHADLGQHDEAEEHLQQALLLAEHHHDVPAQAHTHEVIARAYEQRGNYERGLEHSVRALDLCRTLDNPVWEARALNGAGWFAALTGDHDQAREHCLAALALHREHDDPSGEAGVLDSLGYIAHLAGHHDEAVGHYREALALQRELDFAYGIAETLVALGEPYAVLGRYNEARAVWQEAVELYQQQGRTEEAQQVRDLLAAERETT
jgi:tetratricopeptide (TPR) repeat protein